MSPVSWLGFWFAWKHINQTRYWKISSENLFTTHSCATIIFLEQFPWSALFGERRGKNVYCLISLNAPVTFSMQTDTIWKLLRVNHLWSCDLWCILVYCWFIFTYFELARWDMQTRWVRPLSSTYECPLHYHNLIVWNTITRGCLDGSLERFGNPAQKQNIQDVLRIISSVVRRPISTPWVSSPSTLLIPVLIMILSIRDPLLMIVYFTL